MSKFIFGFLTLIILSFQTIAAQSFEWAYSSNFIDPGTCTDGVSSLHRRVTERVIDDEGNFVRVGTYSGTRDFDHGPGEYFMTDSSLFGASGFIQKMDTDGNLIWAKSLGKSEVSYGNHVAVDAEGNIFIYGEFRDSLDADPGADEFMLYAPNEYDQLFILKLDSDGNFIWANSVEGIDAHGVSLEIDGAGDLIFMGYFRDSIDCDPSPDDYYIGADVDEDVFYRKFLIKWTNDGVLAWAKLLSYQTNSYLGMECTDLDETGAIYITGYFYGTYDFDPGMGVFEMETGEGVRAFIQKLDPDGNFISAHMLGGDGVFPESWIEAIHVVSADHIIIGGHFKELADFDISDGEDWVASTEGTFDAFVMCLDGEGNTVWRYTFGSGGEERVYGLAVNEAGGVIAVGEFNAICDFDNGDETVYLSPEDHLSTWVMELSADGEFEWVKPIVGVDCVLGTDVLTDADEAIYISGSYYGLADLDPSAGVMEFTSEGGGSGRDNYFIKLSECETMPYTEVEDVTACSEYFWPITGVIYTTSGIHLGVVSSVTGCDSIVAINLDFEFEYIDLTVNIDGTILTSAADDATYQWVICDADYGHIDGATDQSYNAVSDGIYAVIITKGVCSDTSDCINFLHFSMDENNAEGITVYPNPTTSNITIKFDVPNQYNYLRIYTAIGELVFEKRMSNQAQMNVPLNVEKGLYIIELEQKNGKTEHVKIVKD
jgi:hypothetical protein